MLWVQFSIRPYQHSSNMNQTGAIETWNSLDSAITQIHEQNASHLSFEELYRPAAPARHRRLTGAGSTGRLTTWCCTSTEPSYTISWWRRIPVPCACRLMR